MTNDEKFDFFVKSLRNQFGKEIISDHMIETCIAACSKVVSSNNENNLNGLSLIQRFMVIQNSGIFNKALQQIKSDTSDKK